MRPSHPTTLRGRAVDCHRRQGSRPAWSEVVDDTARLRVGAAYTDSVTTAGLLGDTAYLAHTGSWPADVNETLERLGLFETYSPTTVHGVLAHLSPHGITGLVNNVKGVDLELQTVEGINSGDLHLPGIDHAQQAQTLNQPGWNLQTSESGHVVGHLQVKATDDWHILAHHLARYPQYQDIVTNHEAIALRPIAAMGTRFAIARGRLASEIGERARGRRAMLRALPSPAGRPSVTAPANG